jgi:hypothetical protein
MGLDVYVRWSDITKAEKDAQFTGFSDAPEVGYMRYNWQGISFVTNEANRIGCQCPLPLHAQWNGYNDGEVVITQKEVDIMREEMANWNEAKGKSGDEYFEYKLTCAEKMAEFIIDKFNEGAPCLTLCFY